MAQEVNTGHSRMGSDKCGQEIIMRFYLQMLAGGQALDKQHRSNGVVARWGVLGRASEDGTGRAAWKHQ